MKNRWIWLVLGVVVLVIGGAVFAVGRMASSPGEDASQFQVEKPTETERELQEIKIAASEGELREAVRGEDGWTVRFEQEVDDLTFEALTESAHTFFRDLDRTDVDVALAGFVAITNTLRDVWGNPLSDVPVLRIELEKETFDRINWQGFQPDDFPRVADYFWIHEIIQRMEQEEQAQEGEQGEGGQGEEGQEGNGGGGS